MDFFLVVAVDEDAVDFVVRPVLGVARFAGPDFTTTGVFAFAWRFAGLDAALTGAVARTGDLDCFLDEAFALGASVLSSATSSPSFNGPAKRRKSILLVCMSTRTT